MTTAHFHDGERTLQDRFDSTRLADAIAEKTIHTEFTTRDREFLTRMDMFFLATSDADGNVDCSYKGGDPGFVRVVDDRTLAFPSYDGNGMFMSLGNVLQHAKVGMLFVDFENPWRMRVNGTATVGFDDPLLADYPGAQCVVRVTPDQIFVNCPRYIHRMQKIDPSPFVPREGCETPDPEWKDHFEDVLPAEQRQRRAARLKSEE
jgi:uncharacterized protein